MNPQGPHNRSSTRDRNRLHAMNPETSSRKEQAERFRDLFQRSFGPVSHYFTRHGFSQEESADLAQETFVRAYRGLGDFRGDAEFKTWLFATARNIGLNAMRARRAQKRQALEVALDDLDPQSSPRFVEVEEGSREETEEPRLPGDDPYPLEGLLSQERSQQLRQALADLPSEMRRCVLLRVGQDLKYREIADLLGISIGTVKSQLFEARQRLAAILSDQFSEVESP